MQIKSVAMRDHPLLHISIVNGLDLAVKSVLQSLWLSKETDLERAKAYHRGM